MPANRKGGAVVTAVWEMAEPLAEQLGLILWDVTFRKEGVNRYLRITIDREDRPVSIDDCVAMNDVLDAPLDSADLIQDAYNLQVSSAGIERELIHDFHFTRFTGSPVNVKFRSAVDGVKLHSCILLGSTGDTVTLGFGEGDEREFSKKDIISVRLDDFDPDVFQKG